VIFRYNNIGEFLKFLTEVSLCSRDKSRSPAVKKFLIF
jgi:hypothetical protein